MSNPGTPKKSPQLEEFPSSIDENYPEVRRRLFEECGWTHWSKCPHTGMVLGVPPGGTAPLKGSGGDQVLWPDPLHNAWGIEALATALVERGWELEVEHNGDHTTVRIWVNSTCQPVQILHHDEPSPARRLRRVLLEAACEAMQATCGEVSQP